LVIKGKKGVLSDIKVYKKLAAGTCHEDSYKFYGYDFKKGVIVLNYNDIDPLLAGQDYFLKK
jgi:hypothetical protein